MNLEMKAVGEDSVSVREESLLSTKKEKEK